MTRKKKTRPMSVRLNDRELATVLAALRYWQLCGGPHNGHNVVKLLM